MNSSEPITLARDVEAAIIPVGEKVTLQKGEQAHITQSLGGSYTVIVNGNMFRIEGKVEEERHAPEDYHRVLRVRPDAVQRAEYYNKMRPDWHTLLNPSLKTSRVMTLVRGTYRFALNQDGTCCAYVLVDSAAFANALFPPTYPVDDSTVMGAAEKAGDVTTKDISTFLFPNTFLYTGSECCALGYHTFDLEPGDASNGNKQRQYVMNYSSWITPGLFGPAFLDDTALSHEMAELFNDPFVASDGIHGITPWWLAPNGNCQDNMETGDVIEGIPQAVFPVTMPNGYTYHPQNEALKQWFGQEDPSSALGGAWSYPNQNTLMGPATVQPFKCGK